MMSRVSLGILAAAFVLAQPIPATAQDNRAEGITLRGLPSDLVDGEASSEPAPTPAPRQVGTSTAADEPPNPAPIPGAPSLRPLPDKTYEELQARLVEQDALIALGIRQRPAAPARNGSTVDASAESAVSSDQSAPAPINRPPDTPVHVILSDLDEHETLVTVNSDGSRTTTTRNARPARGSQRVPVVDPSCPSRLRALGVQFQSLPDFRKQSGCQNVSVLNVTGFGSGVALNPNVHVTCEVAEGMALWMRNSVQAEAARYFGSRVVKLSNTHGYSCRYRSGGKVSEHGYANAIDIGTFHLSDGRQLSVLKNWRSDGTAFGSNAARWFDRINDSACDYFQLVLNPRSNKAHENHFHLDQGPWKSCD